MIVSLACKVHETNEPESYLVEPLSRYPASRFGGSKTDVRRPCCKLQHTRTSRCQLAGCSQLFLFRPYGCARLFDLGIPLGLKNLVWAPIFCFSAPRAPCEAQGGTPPKSPQHVLLFRRAVSAGTLQVSTDRVPNNVIICFTTRGYCSCRDETNRQSREDQSAIPVFLVLTGAAFLT